MAENAFEAGIRKVIPAVLVYLQKKDQVLMIHRNSSRKDPPDYHEGKWNGLGGKCEIDESPLEAALREVKEESGLTLLPSQLKMLGVLQFPNFKAHKNEDWVVFVFTGTLSETSPEPHPELKKTSPEGDLHWIPKQDLVSLHLWPGDRYFIPYVTELKPFAGTIWYEGQAVRKHWIQSLVL